MATKPIRSISTVKHQSICRGCGCISVSLPEIEELISMKSVPLIKIDEVSSMICCVEAAASDITYVAISHVWSFIGHDQGNFMPLCQYYWLIGHISGLTPRPTHMWFDILYIPRANSVTRSAGISQIGQIFSSADHVLVLDEDLVHTNFSYGHWHDTLTRIYGSQWMRRLWTLHEAVLAKNLSFQFANGLFYLNLLSPCLQNGKSAVYTRDNRKIALYALFWASRLRQEPDSEIRMARLWNLLQRRSTSWPEQETICLHNMLRIGPDSLEDWSAIPEDHRMIHFLQLYESFPAELIFMEGPRITIKGFGWSPQSWLSEQSQSEEPRFIDLNDVHLGIRTVSGLKVKYLGACLQLQVRDLVPGLRFAFRWRRMELEACIPDHLNDRFYILRDELSTCDVAIIYNSCSMSQVDSFAKIFKGALVAVGTTCITDSEKTASIATVPTQYLCTARLVLQKHAQTQDSYHRSLSSTTYLVQFYANSWCVG